MSRALKYTQLENLKLGWKVCPKILNLYMTDLDKLGHVRKCPNSWLSQFYKKMISIELKTMIIQCLEHWKKYICEKIISTFEQDLKLSIFYMWTNWDMSQSVQVTHKKMGNNFQFKVSTQMSKYEGILIFWHCTQSKNQIVSQRLLKCIASFHDSSYSCNVQNTLSLWFDFCERRETFDPNHHL